MQVALQNNILVVYMHTRLIVNSIFKDFLQKRDLLTKINIVELAEQR